MKCLQQRSADCTYLQHQQQDRQQTHRQHIRCKQAVRAVTDAEVQAKQKPKSVLVTLDTAAQRCPDPTNFHNDNVVTLMKACLIVRSGSLQAFLANISQPAGLSVH